MSLSTAAPSEKTVVEVPGWQRRSIRERWKRVELGSRDWTVLRYLHEQKFLTFEQVVAIFQQKGRHKYALDPVKKRARSPNNKGSTKHNKCRSWRNAIQYDKQ